MGFFNDMNAETDNMLTEKRKPGGYEPPYEEETSHDEEDAASEELNALLSGEMSSFSEEYDEYNEENYEDNFSEDNEEIEKDDSDEDSEFNMEDIRSASTSDYEIDDRAWSHSPEVHPQREELESSQIEQKKQSRQNAQPVQSAAPVRKQQKEKSDSDSDGVVLTIPVGFIFEGEILGDPGVDKKKTVEVLGTLTGPVSDVTKLVIHEDGMVSGDVKNVGKVKVEGKLHGNVKCDSISVANGKVSGEVCANNIDIKRPAKVIGNIHGKSISLSGAVKGSIFMDESVSLESTAVVKGDIRGKSISIHPGSKVSGTCTALADEEAFDIFDGEDDDE